MSPRSDEILSAFIDGEQVDPACLTEALTAPGARETLIDFVRLRGHMEEGGNDRPSPIFYRRMERVIAPERQTWRRRSGHWVALAAAAISGVLVTSIWYGQTPGAPRPEPTDSPPRAARVIYFDPGVDWHTVEPREGDRP